MLSCVLLVSLLTIARAGSPRDFLFFVHDSKCTEPRSISQYYTEVLRHMDLPGLVAAEELEDEFENEYLPYMKKHMARLMEGGTSSVYFQSVVDSTPGVDRSQVKKDVTQLWESGDIHKSVDSLLSNKKLLRQMFMSLQATTRLRKLSPKDNLEVPLKDLSPGDRRDVVIYMLERLVQQHSNANKATKVSIDFLEKLNLDIIDGSPHLPKKSVWQLLKKLPCALHPAEENFERSVSATPNDQYYAKQWHLHKEHNGANVEGAWDCLNGEDNRPVVAHVDTGCALHPDLEPNLCRCHQNCSSYDATEGNNPFIDKIGHGTMVLSVFGAKTNNGYRHAGISGESRVMCIKVAGDDGRIYFHSVAKAANYILLKEVKIVNFSLNGFGRWKTEEHVFKRLEDEHVLVITAAGNLGNSAKDLGCNIDSAEAEMCQTSEGKKLDGPFPAAYDFENLIVVAASDKEGRAWTGSNYGSDSVDLFAPGRDIHLLHPSSTLDAVPFIEKNGTSLSTAMVTGAVLELLRHDSTLTPIEAKDYIIRNTKEVGHLTGMCRTDGILDAGAAMAELAEHGKPCRKGMLTVSSTPTVKHIKAYEESQCFTKPTPRYLPRYNCEVDAIDWCTSEVTGESFSAGRTAGITIGIVGAVALLAGGGWLVKSRRKQDGLEDGAEMEGEVHVVMMDEETSARSTGLKGKVVGIPARR